MHKVSIPPPPPLPTFFCTYKIVANKNSDLSIFLDPLELEVEVMQLRSQVEDQAKIIGRLQEAQDL